MSDEKKKDDQNNPEEESPRNGAEEQQEGGLGNLPPLSDFDSASLDGDEDESASSGSDLPPLSGFDSDGDDDFGGLPSIDDIPVETPRPTGGNIRPDPSGFDTPGAFDTPMSDDDLETPSDSGEGAFQGQGQDSDFSLETPDIGPGPDSDLDTPMFDSAFGGGESDGGDDDIETPAPTQAMQTPMFDGGGQGGGASTPQDTLGFDEGAFGGGTPVPDFSQDTGMDFQTPPPTGGETPPPQRPPAPKKSGGVMGIVIKAAIVLVVFAIGLFLSPYVSQYVPLVPDPQAGQLREANSEIGRLEAEVRRLNNLVQGGQEISPEDRDRLLQEIEELNNQSAQLTGQLEQLQQNVAQSEQELALIEEDIDVKNEEFVNLQEELDNLTNEKAITEARHAGLLAEVERLTNQVGQLQQADDRRTATVGALQTAVNRLEVKIREGIPLTPERHSRERRLQRVQALSESVAAAKWVDPDLLRQYTSIYLEELDIAASNAYFFARIPVKDELGTTYMKWAECLMNGNRNVFFVTIDGQFAGTYENVSPEGVVPRYAFRQDLPEQYLARIRHTVQAHRVEDFEAKVAVLKIPAVPSEDKSGLQRAFESLYN